MYWKATSQSERFDGAFTKSFLYRPETVSEIVSQVEHVLRMPRRCDVLVKGPQGIGKSHSLGNLVNKGLYDIDGRNLVTFIHVCEYFECLMISTIIHVNRLALVLRNSNFRLPRHQTTKNNYSFVDAIDLFLKNKNKKCGIDL